MSSITSTVTESTDLDGLLGQVDLMLRGRARNAALKKSLEPAKDRAEQLCPVGGPRIGTKTGKKHLNETLKIKVIDYGETAVGLMGPEYPAGAHAHNVEFGHDIVRDGQKAREGRRAPAKVGTVVGRAAPHPFMRPAADQTKSQQIQAFEQELGRWIELTTQARGGRGAA